MSTISASTTSTTAYKVTADTTGTLVLQTGASPTTAMTIDGSQNVTLAGNITLNNGAADGAQLSLSSAGYSDWNIDNYSGNFRWYYNATEYMRLSNSGNLGLGVTPSAWGAGSSVLQNPGGAFWNYGTGSLNVSCNTYFDGTNYRYKNTNYATQYNQSSGIHSWLTASSGTAGNPITFTQAMTLDASGNLLVGTTSTGNSNSKSFVANVASGFIVVNHLNGQGSGSGYASFGYNASEIGSITQNGTTGVLYNLTSDYRLKNDPQPLTGAKDFVMALQPKKWQWWDGSGEGVGFIAHEFMEVAKYSGNGEKDAVDENGNPVYQSIQPSSSEVMANLVALLQEQQAIIETLTNRITALEAK